MAKNKSILRILPFYKSSIDYNKRKKPYDIRKKCYLKRSKLLKELPF